MIPKLHRQRRRILLCAMLMTLSVQIGTMGSILPVAQVPLWVVPVTAAVFFAGCALGIGLLILICPRLRSLCEVVALFVLLEAVFIRLAPGLNADLSNPTLRLAVGAAVLALIHLALYGRLLEAAAPRIALSVRHEVTIRAAPQAIWDEVVPDHGGAARPPGAVDTALRAPRRSKAATDRPAVTFVSRERPVQCRFLVAPDCARPASICDLRLLPDATGTRLRICLTFPALPLGEALHIWLDDRLGVACDALRSQLETPHASRSAPRARNSSLV